VTTTTDASRPSRSGHFVVCGSDSTAVRVIEELRALDEAVTAVVPDSNDDHAQEIAELGATLVIAPRPHEAALRDAGVATARALALVAPDDLGNVHAALTAEELNPSIRLVIHIVNPQLGEHVERLVTNCTVVSAAAMVAPEFVLAALGESEVQWITVGGRNVVIGPAETVATPPLATLARVGANGRTELLPQGPGDLVLSDGIRQKPRRVHPRLEDFITDLRLIFDARLRLVAAFLASVITLGAVVVKLWPHPPGTQAINWLDAFYLALSTVTLTGFDDQRTIEAPAWIRLSAVGVQLLGLVMVSLVTAAIVDAFVGTSLARSLGSVRGRPRGHVVVCGLGTVGTKVAELLNERGFNVVAIERDPDKPGIRTARAMRIPVLLGDVSHPAVLDDARVHRCRAVLAVTNDDVANVQAGLFARERNAGARIVIRMFDHDLAARIQERLGLGTTRSVSILAAPTFAQELLHRRVSATVPAGRRVLMVTEVPIADASPVDGGLLGDLVDPGLVRVLAHRPLGGTWRWEPSLTSRLTAGDRVALVASRSGLARVLLATRSSRLRATSSYPDEDGSA
jgi:Trk K+ transport system NAD-binding subunit